MMNKVYLGFAGLLLSGCVVMPAPNLQTRLEAVSAPLLQTWAAHCKTGLAGLSQHAPACHYEVLIRDEAVGNASADGERVFVTSGLIEKLDDTALALVVAHEMAHNVLGHIEMQASELRESEADRWAMYLLAQAGLDYQQAGQSVSAVRSPDIKNSHLERWQQRRAAHFSALSTELKAQGY